MTENSNSNIKRVQKKQLHIQKYLIGLLTIGGLIAFEVFNYSTTQFSLNDLIGNLSFAGVSWATILAIAFCGIDVAGVARIFTPETGKSEPLEVWYLLGAWLLAATMNAVLTWWSISIAVVNNQTLGNAIVSRESLVKWVPIFLAIMIWVIRVLLIGSFSIAGDRMTAQNRVPSSRPQAISKPSWLEKIQARFNKKKSSSPTQRHTSTSSPSR